MPSGGEDSIEWVVLTMGDRPVELLAALDSLGDAAVCVVVNSDAELDLPAGIRLEEPGENLGIPGGRDRGARTADADIVGFLDDDAVADPEVTRRVVDAFERDPSLGAVALRLVDEHGETARRHIPRLGGRDGDRPGPVALFLGGACAVRREAYLDVGGYFTDLVYGHEELELSWRLVDGGWGIRYLADAHVMHPRTEIGRHEAGWRMTGRNRVAIARRTLPAPVAAIHVAFWLVVGAWRAPGRVNRAAYVAGWRAGWRLPVDRRPIGWRGVWRLCRLGRPPFV